MDLKQIFAENANDHYHRFGLSKYSEGSYLRVMPYDAMTEGRFIETVSALMAGKDKEVSRLFALCTNLEPENISLKAEIDRLRSTVRTDNTDVIVKAQAEIDELRAEVSRLTEKLKGASNTIHILHTQKREEQERHEHTENIYARLRGIQGARVKRLTSEIATLKAQIADMEDVPIVDWRYEHSERIKEIDALKAEVERLKAESMNAFQTELGIWQDATFPGKTNSSIIEHLSREVMELRLANATMMSALEDPIDIAEFQRQSVKLSHELADVLILAFGMAHHISVQASVIMREKFEINKARIWGKPDEHGVVEHVEPITPNEYAKEGSENAL